MDAKPERYVLVDGHGLLPEAQWKIEHAPPGSLRRFVNWVFRSFRIDVERIYVDDHTHNLLTGGDLREVRTTAQKVARIRRKEDFQVVHSRVS